MLGKESKKDGSDHPGDGKSNTTESDQKFFVIYTEFTVWEPKVKTKTVRV